MDLVLNRSDIYEFLIPHACQKEIHRIFELGNIIKKEYEPEGLKVKVELNKEDVWEFEDFFAKKLLTF